MNLPFIRYKNLGGTFVRFVTIHACDGQTDGQTDGWTDRQTDTFAIRKTALHTMQRGKNSGRLPDPNSSNTSPTSPSAIGVGVIAYTNFLSVSDGKMVSFDRWVVTKWWGEGMRWRRRVVEGEAYYCHNPTYSCEIMAVKSLFKNQCVWHHDVRKTRCALKSRAASIKYPTENQPTFNTCSVAWMGILIQVGHILRIVQMINTAARYTRRLNWEVFALIFTKLIRPVNIITV